MKLVDRITLSLVLSGLSSRHTAYIAGIPLSSVVALYAFQCKLERRLGQGCALDIHCHSKYAWSGIWTASIDLYCRKRRPF